MSGELGRLREALHSASPTICDAVFSDLAPRLLPTPARKEGNGVAGPRFKDLNDPIWKTITLEGIELSLLDLPLMQRLRHVRQLGMAYLVFPSATHSRLEHSIGALHATKLVFDRLRASSLLENTQASHLRSVLSIAALVHDCGHPAFSHVGERVLQTLYRKEFDKLRDVLDEFFVDEIASKKPASGTGVVGRRKPPPAAELLSVLLVLSPAMEEVLRQSDLPNPSDAILMACGLVIGRPKNLVFEGKGGSKTYHHFVKAIVSGDLDADKLDYVARDAYFAGMPISADMTRLLSQLAVAELDKTTEFDKELNFDAPNPARYELLGIKPAGCSALEMFVMTRSYLFERIYCHHKVRAAERIVERLLRQRLQFAVTVKGWAPKEVLNFLFNQGGDDAVLWQLKTEVVPEDDEERFKGFANKILLRHLPQRALALSPRMLVDYKKGLVKLPSGAAAPWDRADVHLREDFSEMEEWICDVTGLAIGDQVYIDPPVSNPIKENPDIWVLDKIERTRLVRVNRYFDAEQLANAYQDVKQVAWIFAGQNDRELVAAASAVYLAMKFDLVIGEEAIRHAKITKSAFSTAIEKLKPKFDDAQRAAADNLLAFNASNQRIRSVPEQFESALLPWDVVERSVAAKRLASEFAAVGVSRSYYGDFLAALLVLSFLARHSTLPNVAAEIDAMPQSTAEARFQAHLINYLHSQQDFMLIFNAKEHTKSATGFTDIVISSVKGDARDIVVELKAEKNRYQKMVDAHAGQPCRYAEDLLYARVSFLYCQFADSAFQKVSDTLQVRKPSNSGNNAPHAILTLGTKGFLQSPSAGPIGKATTAAGGS